MRIKKLLLKTTALSLSAVILLSGCHNSRFDRFQENESQTKNEEQESGTNDNEPETKDPSAGKPGTVSGDKNPVDKEFTDEEKAVQEDFDDFLTDVYVEAMSYSVVSTHFDLKNPEAFSITEFDSIWGDFNIEDYENAKADDEELYKELTSYDYSALTYDQQLTYDTFAEYIENSMILDEYFYFGESLSPSSGAQFELPLLLSEYAIFDEDDIKEYLEVLASCDEYIASLLEYEKWRSENGYALTDNAIDEVIEQCNDILSAPEPAFLSVINEVIDGCDFLTDDAKASYKTQIKQLAFDNFVPAYQSIVSELGKLKGSRSVDGGLCQYDGGKEYYEALIRLYTGSDKTVDELIETIESEMYSNLMSYSMLASKDPQLTEKAYGELEYIYTEPDEILTNLMIMLQEDFPAPACEEYDLKYVAESMESSSNPAFYLIPQYDNYTRNIIYVNNNEEYADMDLFPLLAHEGMPGHMYQNNYFLSLNPHPIRSLLHFSGYAEGWAKYVEHYSYTWSGLEEAVGQVLTIDDVYGFGLYSRVDIGINYEGWDLADVEEFIVGYGIGAEFAQELYDLFINDPSTYLQYYVGCLEIEELRDEAEELLEDDFNIKDFHTFILTVGPTYYDIIQERMYMWIEEIQ